MLTVYLFFIVLLVCTNPIVQQELSRLIGKDKPDGLSGLLMAFFGAVLLICITYFTKQNVDKTNESFFFEVSKNKPRCNGLYTGMPTRFQYDQIGCKHNYPVTENNQDFIEIDNKPVSACCCDDKNPSHGYVAGDDNASVYDDMNIFKSGV